MKVQTPRGTRDFLGKDMKLKRIILNKIIENFEKYGFEEAQTPAFENFEILSIKGGGESIKDEIYYFKDKSGRELGLRFDFTVPLARMFSCNPTLPWPYKRYQFGQVWRYDRPGKGRYREFTQADADIVGVRDQSADSELLALLCDCMTSLEIKNYIIRVNSRKIAEGIIKELNLEKKSAEIFRTLDKLDKIGLENVEKELKEKKIKVQKINQLLEFVQIKGKNQTIISKLKEKIKNDIGIEGIWEIERILNFAQNYGIEKQIKLDLSLVRGLDYYTGFIFELKITEGNLNLSCAGGGRYDNLIEKYSKIKTPAVGFSFGIDRLCDILKEKTKLKREGIFIAVQDKNFEPDGIALAQKLRNSGLKVSIELMNRKISKQISYAAGKNFKYLIVLGEKEIKDKKVKVKDLDNRKEVSVEIRKLNKFLLGL